MSIPSYYMLAMRDTSTTSSQELVMMMNTKEDSSVMKRKTSNNNRTTKVPISSTSTRTSSRNDTPSSKTDYNPTHVPSYTNKTKATQSVPRKKKVTIAQSYKSRTRR